MTREEAKAFYPILQAFAKDNRNKKKTNRRQQRSNKRWLV